MSRIGAIALARPTFDVAYAEEVAGAAFDVLDAVAPDWAGPRHLLFDAASTVAAIEAFAKVELNALVVLQVTFTDATMAKALAATVSAPLVLWAFPEDRTGGRLRLNSLCGINLAAFALRRAGARFSFLYRRTSDQEAPGELTARIQGDALPPIAPSYPNGQTLSAAAHAGAARAVAALRGATTGVIGDHPDGFDPCAYDAAVVAELFGVEVQRVELADLFTAATAAQPADVDAARTRAGRSLGPLDDLDQGSLDHSLRIYCGLERLATEGGWAGFATRCWPECFTEYGAAACAPQAMLTDDGVPGGCEADAYGTLTSLLLRELAHEPPFVADLVDIDVATDTATLWHCGVAPLHMADPAIPPRPTVHSNRVKPLLHEFPLKPGRVTVARLSQAAGSHSLVIGGGEMLRAPLAYSGTAGVMRFDRPAAEVLTTVMGAGLEHHYGIVYGDYRDELQAVAGLWNLPTIQLS